MKKILLMSLIVLIVVIGVIGLYLMQPRSEEKIKIGIILPLTGELSDQGQSSKNGIILATEEINNNGGINGKKVEAIFEDSQCQPANAVSAFYKLVDIDKVNILVGDICSSASLAIADLADKRKIVLVNAGTVAKQLTKSPYVFRIWFSEVQLGSRLAEKASAISCKKMAIFYVNNDFGEGFTNVVEEKFPQLGGEIALSQPFNQDETDFKTGLLKATENNPDCYFLALYPNGLIAALKQMKEMGINKTVFAHGGIVGAAQTMDVGKNVLEGVMAPSFIEPSKEFQTAYEKRFGSKVGVTGDAAYDATKIIAEVIAKNGLNPEKIREGLLKIKDFLGVTGKITIDENRETNRPLIMTQVINGKMVEIK